LGFVSIALLVLHAALALAVFALCRMSTLALIRSVRDPAVFSGEVPSLAWALPPAFAGAFLLMRLVQFARGRRGTTRATLAIGVVLLATLAGRIARSGSEVVGYTRLSAAPPSIQTVTAMRELQQRAQAGVREHGQVPDAATLSAPIMDEGSELIPSYSYRWTRRPFRVVRRADQSGPVDRPVPGELPGTLYVSVSPDGRHYWITATVLIDEHGHRVTDFLPSSGGVYVLSNAG